MLIRQLLADEEPDIYMETLSMLRAVVGALVPQMSTLDVHLMLLQDEQLSSGVKHWIQDRHYNAEWAVTTQYEAFARQFDEMEDPYLRERTADLEQVTERLLRYLKGAGSPVQPPAPARRAQPDSSCASM